MALLLAVWGVAAAARYAAADRNIATDALFFGGLVVTLARRELAGFIAKSWDVGEALLGSSLTPTLFGSTALLLAVPLVWPQRRHAPPPLLENAVPWTLTHPKAAIFPCRTKHARLFPKRHTFDYSYLQCGFPIVPAGTTPDGDVGSERDRRLGSWWLHIRADDYLTRGHGELGFYGKLAMFLREQQVPDNEWSYAYLITAPRFLGYSFNPVSFWYIYDREHQLKKMILEVNNTFGERRMYLLNGSSSSAPPTPSSIHDGPFPDGVKSRFTDMWMKDFHVSPFNSRKGSYSLRALNPFPYATFTNPTIDNTITLISSKDHAKVVARLHSTGSPLDPNLGVWGTVRFVLSWWWVGLVTFPRIVREAGKLFFKRSLHVWFRPEVLAPSLGRLPTSSEMTFHAIFYAYLEDLAARSPDSFHITLHTAIPLIPTQTITTTRPGAPTHTLALHVLTPAFYSRFIHYAQTTEAFDRECTFTDEKNRTLWISRPSLLIPLLAPRSTIATETSHPNRPRSLLDNARWSALRALRCPPPEPVYNPTPVSLSSNKKDIRPHSFSQLEDFARTRRDGTYRRAATKAFLAQRVGGEVVVSVLDWVVRAVLCWAGASATVSRLGKGRVGGGSEWWEAVVPAAVVSGVHVWEFLKGYT